MRVKTVILLQCKIGANIYVTGQFFDSHFYYTI